MRNSRRWILVIFWVLLIAYFSRQPFQHQDLRPVISSHPQLIHFVQQMPLVEFHYHRSLINSHSHTVGFIQFVIRKIMHMTIYGLFGLSLLFALSSNRKAIFKNWLLTALLIVSIASLDELNQHFSTTRTGCFEDVMMDFSGFLIFSFIQRLASKNKSGLF
jgi:VanZ family protein